MGDGSLPRRPEGVVKLGPEEFRTGFTLHRQTNTVAVGKLDDQSCQLKEGVGLGTGTDLLGNSLQRGCLRNQADLPSFKHRLDDRLGTTIFLPRATRISSASCVTIAPWGSAASAWTTLGITIAAA